jgi:hypothetical protein
MSHFTCLIIESKRDAEDLLAPFDENTEVEPYEVDCYCAEYNLNKAAERAAEQTFGGTFAEVMRESYADLPVNERPNWSEYVAPWVEFCQRFKTEHPEAQKPNAECEDCKGTGRHMSTYNPKSKWDWYQLGGRWDGMLETIRGKVNRATLDELIAPIPMTFAFIDADGAWHEKAKMGWWALTSDEREDVYKTEWDAMIASLKPDDLVSVYDLHI